MSVTKCCATEIINSLVEDMWKISSDDDDKRELVFLEKLYYILQEIKEGECVNRTSTDISQNGEFIGENGVVVDKMEEDFLLHKIDNSRIPKMSISAFLKFDSDLINKFVFCIFVKQYGWTEHCPADNEFHKRLSSGSSVRRQDLCVLLESFITW